MGSDETDDIDWHADDWHGGDWESIPDEPISRRNLPTSWRVIGIVAALSLLVIPVLNLINAGPQFADNGLEIYRFDYCVVEQHVAEVGLLATMTVMSSIIVPDDEVQAYVDEMIAIVEGPSVRVDVVDELPGDLGGRYFPDDRLIQLDRPVRLWVIAHEVAHAVAPGHDDEFVDTLVELALHFERTTG